jgi:RNA polymerase sigma factor (sigma-70 family)
MPSKMAVARPDEISAGSARVETMEELFTALESPLLSYALRLVRNTEAAEDVVQEAFMKLQINFDQVREPRRWLYRTVHNLALNQQRRSGKIVSLDTAVHQTTPPGMELTDPQSLPDEEIARSEGIGLVRLSLESLDDRSRELIRLKFTDGLSYQEMSTRTGLTVGNVGYLLHHALKTIATELTRNGGLL